MSTLRNALKFLDVIMDKKNPEKMYMVLNQELHNVWVTDMNGEKPPFELPKRIINMVYIKVDPKAVKVLFSERIEENAEESTPDYGQTDKAVTQE